MKFAAFDIESANPLPDGKKIAYTARTINPVNGNNFDIYVVDIDGENKRQITFHPGNDYCPEWANDGNSLYFVSQRGNKGRYHSIWNISLVKYLAF
jgi:Tol biopolymer transport system component